jgi:hypothetical protein
MILPSSVHRGSASTGMGSIEEIQAWIPPLNADVSGHVGMRESRGRGAEVDHDALGAHRRGPATQAQRARRVSDTPMPLGQSLDVHHTISL